MPFGSYQLSKEQAYANATKLMQAGAHVVKLEGGELQEETIQFLTKRGIAVCAHIGLTPQSVQFSFWHTLVEIFYVTVLPTILGFYFRRLFSMAGIIINKYLNRILPLLLILIFGMKFFAGAIYGGANITISIILSLAPWMIILNMVSMAAGFFFGRISKLNNRNALTCTIEIGLHNTALALIIAGEKIGNKTMEQPALVYALFSFLITLGIGFILSRWFPFKSEVN